MMEFLAIAAIAVILWMLWQLFRARKFNQFKLMIMHEIRPLVIAHLEKTLVESRSEQFPNTDAHIEACSYYWGQYPSRVLQAAIAWQLVESNWLENTGNTRHCQHLFFIEKDKLAEFKNENSDNSVAA